MLVAHGLPIETAIGRPLRGPVPVPVLHTHAGAFVLAWHAPPDLLGHRHPERPGPHALPDRRVRRSGSIASWALGQVRNLASIFCIIFALISIMRVLGAIGAIALMNRILRPVLNLIGIGPKASAITVIGLTMGLSYGGGLIINEARNGKLSKEDIFYS